MYIINEDPKNKLRWLFIPLMTLWSYNGIMAYSIDYKKPFSNGLAITKVLANNKLPMCCNNGVTTESINFYNHQKVYSLDMDTVYDYFVFQNRITTDLKNDSVLYKFALKNDSFIYIQSLDNSSSKINSGKQEILQNSFKIDKIWTGEPTVVADENFEIYKFKKK